MPKLLYLVRHAQSAEKQQGQADKDRELTPTGVKEALQVGTFLYQEKILLDVIYSSIALRAQTTAQLIADAMRLDHDKILYEEELFQASVRTFLEFIAGLDDSYSYVMCVGHNPTISYLAEYISKSEIGDVPPAGTAIIKFNVHSWKDVPQQVGQLMVYTTPTLLTNSAEQNT